MFVKFIFGPSGPSPEHFSVANLSILSLLFILFLVAIGVGIIFAKKDTARQRKKLGLNKCPGPG